MRSGRNNTSLTGVNVSTETDDACEGLGKPECCKKCASSAFQAMAALEVKQVKHKHCQLAHLSDGMCNPVYYTHLLRHFTVLSQGVCILTNMDGPATPKHSQCPLLLLSLLLLESSIHGMKLGVHFLMLTLPGPSSNQTLGKKVE